MYRSAFCALASVAVLASFTTTGFAIQLGPGSPEPPAGWLPRAVEQITKGQYGFSSVGAGVFLARNKAQGLEVRLDARGIELALRGHPADGWKETLRVWGFGREGAIAPVGQAVPRVDGNRAELRRDEMTEWYINRTGGIEQGFTITAPASGDAARPLVIEIRLSGDLDTRADGSPSVVFSTRRAQPVLHYGALKATDSAGRRLPARIEALPGRLRILIADRAAVYPVVVDPLMTSHAWETDGSQVDGYWGYAVTGIGDVNHDGYDDVALGSPYLDDDQVDEGMVFVFMGSASGLSTTPAWKAESNEPNSFFGFSVARAGDVNKDGYDDLLVGAHESVVNGMAGAGKAYLWFGGPSSPSNPSGLGPDGTPANADWSASGSQTEDRFGYRLNGAGDVNGDGYADIIVSAPLHDKLIYPDEGKVFVFYGSTTGPATSPSWTGESSQQDAHFGAFVASAGDVNRDGYGDIIIGADGYEPSNDPTHLNGEAFVYLGSATGLGPNGTPQNADWTAMSDQVGDIQFGYWVGSADVNGDGYSDVIVGSPEETVNGIVEAGRAFLWMGGPSGTGNPSGLGPNGTPSNADWRVEGNQANGLMGYLVESAGDVNGDGYDDVLLSSPFWDVGADVDEGEAWVWFGSASGLGPNGTPSNADWTVHGEQAGALYGRWAASAGDVNGDGFDDVIVGSPSYVEGGLTNAGSAYLYLGTCGNLDADGDGVAPAGAPGCNPGNFTDCNDADGGAWATPGEVTGLLLSSDKQTLDWNAPATGGTPSGMRYDTLRSSDPSNFVSGAVCVESNDGPNTTATDASVPAAGSVFYYLIRAENSCPNGSGSLGKNSSGAERTGRNCP